MTFLLQQHERSYNFHRCSSVSLRWAGTSGFPFATVGAPSVPFGSRVRWESSKASGSRPESCLFPFVVQPLFPESDSRWKVASCWRVVFLTGLFVVGDQFRYGFHSSIVDSCLSSVCLVSKDEVVLSATCSSYDGMIGCGCILA